MSEREPWVYMVEGSVPHVPLNEAVPPPVWPNAPPLVLSVTENGKPLW